MSPLGLILICIFPAVVTWLVFGKNELFGFPWRKMARRNLPPPSHEPERNTPDRLREEAGSIDVDPK